MSATRNDGGKTRGGKSYTGAAVAVLMLETRFPRIHGDIGCATTWDFPVHYKVVRRGVSGSCGAAFCRGTSAFIY